MQVCGKFKQSFCASYASVVQRPFANTVHSHRLFLILVSVVASLGILLCALAALPIWLSAPANQYFAPADVIVSLGGDPGDRVLRALELYRNGLAPQILLMTQDGSGNADPTPFPDLRGKLLQSNGVPLSAIHYDTAPQSTWEEAQAAHVWMQACGWKRAIVVSDAAHARRIQFAFGKVLNPFNLDFSVASTAPENYPFGLAWLAHKETRWRNISELKKNLYYLRYHFDFGSAEKTTGSEAGIRCVIRSPIP